MIEIKKCPICQVGMMPSQPEPVNNRQDVFFNCGGAVSYDIGNPDGFEETGTCSNKIDWEYIYIDYGAEFDESAKLVDSRFYGWVELDFYKSAHRISWINDNPDKNCTDIEFLDKYFENKELYINSLKKYINKDKGILDFDVTSILNVTRKIAGKIVVKNFMEYNFGELVLEEVDSIELRGYNKEVFKVISSQDNPTMVDGYIIDSIPTGDEERSVVFYDREIIDIIVRKERFL